jgi:3-chloro-4-hydroxyphenylacetate reductive dehalogenase
MEKHPSKAAAPGRSRLNRYPMEKLKRVDDPTTKITGSVTRPDERHHGFARAMRGELGPVPQKEMKRFVSKYPLGASFARIMAPLGSVVDGDVAKTRAPISEDPAVLSRHIKQLARFLRSDITGICRLPPYAVYSHDRSGKEITLEHKNAIVLVVDQDYETMLGSTGDDWISSSQSFIGYSNTALISCVLADYIRRLGYPARAHNAMNYQVVVPPLLLLSGIGEMSRAGIVLNPFLGLRYKAAVVTTDMPLEPDKPVDFELQEFCDKCLKCSMECPSNAIPRGGKVIYNGYETWHFDADQCSKFRTANPHGSACGRCLKVCPWNKPGGWTHDTARWMIKNMPFMDSLLVKMDDFRGYGKQDQRYKWWFDLEDSEGVLKIPEK